MKITDLIKKPLICMDCGNREAVIITTILKVSTMNETEYYEGESGLVCAKCRGDRLALI